MTEDIKFTLRITPDLHARLVQLTKGLGTPFKERVSLNQVIVNILEKGIEGVGLRPTRKIILKLTIQETNLRLKSIVQRYDIGE